MGDKFVHIFPHSTSFHQKQHPTIQSEDFPCHINTYKSVRPLSSSQIKSSLWHIRIEQANHIILASNNHMAMLGSTFQRGKPKERSVQNPFQNRDTCARSFVDSGRHRTATNNLLSLPSSSPVVRRGMTAPAAAAAAVAMDRGNEEFVYLESIAYQDKGYPAHNRFFLCL